MVTQTPTVDLAKALGRYSDIDASVYTQQLHHLALRRSDILAHLLVGGAAWLTLWRLYPPWAPPLWFALLILVVLGREQIQRRFREASADPQASRIWARRFTWGALATGVVWSLLASAFLVTSDISYQALALALMGGMTIAGIARNAASTPMMIAFVSPVIGATAIAMLVHPNSFHIAVAVMLGAFAIVLATAGRTLHQSVNADLRLTLELVKTGTTLASAQGVARIGSWEVDAASRRMIWSDAMFQILGVDDATAAPSIDLILGRVHAEDEDRVRTALEDWLSCAADLAVDHRVRGPDGATRWIHQFGLTQQDAQGRPTRHTAIVQDITERKDAEQKLQVANVVMKTQLEASQDGVLVVDNDRRVISFNERFAELHDCPRSVLEAGGYDAVLAHVLGRVADPEAYARRVRFYDDNPGIDGEDELEIVGGRFIECYTVSLNTADGVSIGRAWFHRDVTDEKLALARALETSRRDPLTGLANRVAFVEAVRAAIDRADRDGVGFAILYVDLDHFKDVNDALGHPAGDELLRTVSARLVAAARPSDKVARFGGDEFAVIAHGVTSAEEASRLASGLIAVISEPYAVGGVPLRTSASVGIALHEAGSADAETMLSRADLALYSAKAQGRSRHRPFTAAMDSEVRLRLALGAELHEALTDGQMYLLYQPQIDLRSRRLVGVEALARWRHPQRGVLSPALFIPIAEQTGAIGKLGQWVLATAAAQARAWLDAGAPPIRVGVNVSSLQLQAEEAFEAEIDAVLAENRLDPASLELELTETVLMSAYREREGLLPRLRERGLTIAIDDFGTGYCSLDYLRRFPIDRIKIAQNFVRDLEATNGDAAIVKAAIGLGRDLGMSVIAEGVEGKRQLSLLEAWGCTEAQGYYFAKPMAAAEITPMVMGEMAGRTAAA
jgi:diguanylate cyclase (GGDEF)-like protein/PAS domain S-box-containing protein